MVAAVEDNTRPIEDVGLLFAGRAVFTVSGPNGHYTYRIAYPQTIKLHYKDGAVAREDVQKLNGGSVEYDPYAKCVVIKAGIRDVEKTEKKHGKLRYERKDAPLFVSYLTGPDNMSDYTYLGIWDGEGMKLTRNSRHQVVVDGRNRYSIDWAETVQLKKRFEAEGKKSPVATGLSVILWVIYLLTNGKELPAGYEIRHAGLCMRCGRQLTVPSSIDMGLGPECAARMDGSWDVGINEKDGEFTVEVSIL